MFPNSQVPEDRSLHTTLGSGAALGQPPPLTTVVTGTELEADVELGRPWTCHAQGQGADEGRASMLREDSVSYLSHFKNYGRISLGG